MLQCDQRQSDPLRRNEAKDRRNADNDGLMFEMLKAWSTVLDPSRFSICCHSPLVSPKRLRALTVVIMDPSFYKVVAFISFITLGWCLRKFNVLKPEAFQAISGLVMFVTLPCTTITGLNGTTIGGEMALIALLGFLANIAFLIVAFLWTMRAADKDERDFRRLNTCGLSIGPFAVPYVQAFLPTSGLVTTLMADVGNAVMAAGGTYALIESMRSKTSWLSMAKRICYNLLHSGPIVAFLFMVVLCLLEIKLPEVVTTVTGFGAAANTFLCMIMIGESINLSVTFKDLLYILKILAVRLVIQVGLALFFWYCLPWDYDVRRALVLVAFAPVPAMNLIYTAALEGDLGKAANLNSLSVAMAIICMSTAIYLM